ncbi:hypothetical protein AGMMS50218_18090 [Actinomycetota bacterium]|nr:hypothetical protein AGMMS50218_18090 [Actinomycetota bacterium]
MTLAMPSVPLLLLGPVVLPVLQGRRSCWINRSREGEWIGWPGRARWAGWLALRGLVGRLARRALVGWLARRALVDQPHVQPTVPPTPLRCPGAMVV